MSSLGELRRVAKSAKGAVEDKAARTKDNKAAYLFLLPWLIGLGLITIIPMVSSLVLSFTDYNLLRAPSFNGLDNWIHMLSDEHLQNSLRVTFTYVFISVPLQLGFALALAVLLNRGLRGLAFYRSIYYLPSLLGTSVAIAVLWRAVFGGEGLVNQVLAVFGINGESWIGSPDTALSTLVVLNVWTFGSPMVIFLAGLRQIPEGYYDAAQVDGAGAWTRFTRITLPLLTPIIFFNLVLQVVHTFQAFTQAFVISGGTGGPLDSTLFYTVYLYKRGFGNFDMGYASALAWLLVLIIAAFTAINFWAAKYWVFYDD
ncbi:MAG: sugar transporter permease [Rhodoglobus sp.]|nr:sugar transporter permease [Rhodoglobus sp.]